MERYSIGKEERSLIMTIPNLNSVWEKDAIPKLFIFKFFLSILILLYLSYLPFLPRVPLRFLIAIARRQSNNVLILPPYKKYFRLLNSLTLYVSYLSQGRLCPHNLPLLALTFANFLRKKNVDFAAF